MAKFHLLNIRTSIEIWHLVLKSVKLLLVLSILEMFMSSFKMIVKSSDLDVLQ